MVGCGMSWCSREAAATFDLSAGGSSYIPLPAQLAVSGDGLVVPDVADDFVRDDLVGLGAAENEFRARLGIK